MPDGIYVGQDGDLFSGRLSDQWSVSRWCRIYGWVLSPSEASMSGCAVRVGARLSLGKKVSLAFGGFLLSHNSVDCLQ